MAIPVLVVFALALVWALMAASAQIRCVDAAHWPSSSMRMRQHLQRTLWG